VGGAGICDLGKIDSVLTTLVPDLLKLRTTETNPSPNHNTVTLILLTQLTLLNPNF